MKTTSVSVGLAQISELIWERRPSQHYRLEGKVLRPNAMGAAGVGAALAYLPHSTGLLQAYVQKYASDPGCYRFITPLYQRIPVEEAVAHLSRADVVGFSAYVWNVRLSLAIARALKSRRPDTLIVFGGPQVPNDAAAFLYENPFVDIVCHGEGERTFLEILERRLDRRWEEVQSISYVRPDGRFANTVRRERIRDLDEVPSPLLEGAYDELMRANPKQNWLLTWETNRGCPFSCTFCDWGSATGSKVFRYSLERIADEIEWMAERDIHHLVVCDANFGMLERDVEIARMLAEAYVRRGSYLAVSVQNTKNRTERSEQIQRVFRDAKVISFGASISLQSVDPTVLKAVRRDNINPAAFERLQRHYARERLDTYTDLILGLPGESYDSFADGVDRVIRGGQLNRVAFYDCTILPNAPMANSDYRAEHGLETIPVRIIPAYQSLHTSHADEAPELIDVVISSRTLTRDEWVRAHVFADLVELLFYDRLLHVAMVVLGDGFGLSYRRMIEAFLDAEESEHPIAAQIVASLAQQARDLQRGASPCVAAPDVLNLWWPRDQYALIRLAREGLFDRFYDEAAVLLVRCAASADRGIDLHLIRDALRLNLAMFAVPFVWNDETMALSYPIASAYCSILAGRKPDLARRSETVRVERSNTVWLTWGDWYEDLVRRIYLRKNYLCPIHIVEAVTPTSHLEPGLAMLAEGCAR
jgi:radical SAM superfamily enzyme YgiQ (UPF0313 family)